jgi:hypothetical protein
VVLPPGPGPRAERRRRGERAWAPNAAAACPVLAPVSGNGVRCRNGTGNGAGLGVVKGKEEQYVAGSRLAAEGVVDRRHNMTAWGWPW